MSWIRTLWMRLMVAIGRPAGGIVRGIEAVLPYLPQIYDWVRTIAQLTPTRSDDEIMRAADALGVPLLLEPGADRGQVLARIVIAAARRKWPQASERIIRRAIEIALGGVT